MQFSLRSLIAKWREISSVTCATIAFCGATANAGPREEAYLIYNRLNGVPPDKATLDKMTALVQSGQALEAAALATEEASFYNITLRTWVAPWTNKDDNSNVPLNDFSATVVGMVRDNVPFDQVLYGDLLYTGADALVTRPTAPIAAYSLANNDHYQDLTDQQLDLKANLVQKKQSEVTGIGDVAGVMTTRGFAAAFFTMGTNRAALRFTMRNFLCRDLEQLSDTSIPDYRIRHDVDRSPGGDSKVFRSKCAGCHAGMDGLAGAFAHYDFVDETLVFDGSKVQPKFLVNSSTFPDGYTTTDDSWINLWTQGQNSNIGWRGAEAGQGAKEYGQMITQTDAFATCMATKVFEKVCVAKPMTPDDLKIVEVSAAKFASGNGFNMRQLFIDTTVACIERQ